MGAPARFGDWFFRSRETGKITLAQFPNPPAWIFLGASVVQRVADLRGAPRGVLRAIAVAAAVWWAGDELIRGVNPFRRLLGATVLGITIWGLVTGR